METVAWGREHEDGSIFLHFSHWHGSMGKGNDYLFCSFFFRLHIFVVVGLWRRESGGRSMVMGVFF